MLFLESYYFLPKFSRNNGKKQFERQTKNRNVMIKDFPQDGKTNNYKRILVSPRSPEITSLVMFFIKQEYGFTL